MARTPEPKQAEPTQPRPADEAGRVIDADGLPIGGPARARALAGKPDPALIRPTPALIKPDPALIKSSADAVVSAMVAEQVRAAGLSIVKATLGVEK